MKRSRDSKSTGERGAKFTLPSDWWDRFDDLVYQKWKITLEAFFEDKTEISEKHLRRSKPPHGSSKNRISKNSLRKLALSLGYEEDWQTLLVALGGDPNEHTRSVELRNDTRPQNESLGSTLKSLPPESGHDGMAEKPIPPAIQKHLEDAAKLADNDRFNAAIPVLEQALKAALRGQHQTAETKIRLRLGHALFEGKEDFSGAEAHFREALKLAGDAPSVMRHSALHGLGDMLLWAGQLDEANAVIRAGLEIAKTLGSQDAIGGSLISLGLLERRLGHAELAKSHFDESIRVHHQLSLNLQGDKAKECAHALAVCYQNKALLESDDGRPEEALSFYAKVEELHRASGDKLNSGKVHLLTGKLQCANGDAERGFRSFKQALAVFLDVKNNLWMARAIECIARLEAQHERWEAAAKSGLAAQRGFKQAGAASEHVHCLIFCVELLRELMRSEMRKGLQRQIHEIWKTIPKEKEAAAMAGFSIQSPEWHEEIEQKIRTDSALNRLINEAKTVAAKHELHEELAECLLAEMRLVTRKEDKESKLPFIEKAIAARKRALEATRVPRHRGHLMGELHALYRGLGNKTDAALWLRRAGESFEKAGDVFGLANYHGSLAEMHRESGNLDEETAAYKKILELIDGRSFHQLAAGTRINLAAASRFKGDFKTALALMAEAEAICTKHRIKEFIPAIARNRADIETEQHARQVASHTLPQLLGSLGQLLHYKPESAISYLAFWYFAFKTELMALLRSGPGISLMIVTDDVQRFMAFATKFSGLAEHFLMATTQKPSVAAVQAVLPIPPSWRFPANFRFMAIRKSKPDAEDAEQRGERPDSEDEMPNFKLSGPAAMLPQYNFVSVPSNVPGEGHVATFSTPQLPRAAIDLMVANPIEELTQKRAIWFPSPRFDSEDAFLTDLRVAHERGLFPVYFDCLPTSDAAAAIGGVEILISTAVLTTDSIKLTEKWKRSLLKILRLQKAEAQAALLDLPNTLSEKRGTETVTRFEVRLFEFMEIDRLVVHPVLLQCAGSRQ